MSFQCARYDDTCDCPACEDDREKERACGRAPWLSDLVDESERERMRAEFFASITPKATE